MTARVLPLALLALAGLACLTALSACDDSIDTPDSLRGTYTIWGALDPTARVQALRVVPVKDTISTGTAAPLPITVTSTNLVTGEVTAWRDSVVTFPGPRGGVGHIYQARFRPAYESRHRVVVRGEDDGGEISAVVAVPPRVEPVRQATRFPAGAVTLPLLWPGAPQVNRVRVTYLVQDRSCGTEAITRDFSGASGTSGPVEFGWLTALDLSAEAGALARVRGGRVGLKQITIRGEVASEDWRPPGGLFDFDVLAEPTTLGNVSGGFGFVGAAYPVEVSFRPLLSDLATAGFLDTSNCTG